jgi:hypothetical protein
MMNPSNLSRMFISESAGWPELVRLHPSVAKLFLSFVVPMSLVPPAMFAYSVLVTPGAVFPELAPQMTPLEAAVVAVLLLAAELAMVPLMAMLIQQLGDLVDLRPAYEDAFTLAAVAPAPLWLSPLALFVPSMPVNLLVLALAWIGSVALIRHGVRPLFRLEDPAKSHLMANVITLAGVLAWIALMVMQVMLLSVIMGWR